MFLNPWWRRVSTGKTATAKATPRSWPMAPFSRMGSGLRDVSRLNFARCFGGRLPNFSLTLLIRCFASHFHITQLVPFHVMKIFFLKKNASLLPDTSAKSRQGSTAENTCRKRKHLEMFKRNGTFGVGNRHGCRARQPRRCMDEPLGPSRPTLTRPGLRPTVRRPPSGKVHCSLAEEGNLTDWTLHVITIILSCMHTRCPAPADARRRRACGTRELAAVRPSDARTGGNGRIESPEQALTATGNGIVFIAHDSDAKDDGDKRRFWVIHSESVMAMRVERDDGDGDGDGSLTVFGHRGPF
jgi:hypothetical protein